jgi:small Trp-rich protein
MYLVWLGASLVLLKYFEVLFFKDFSWWWVLAPLFLAFVYFEVLEPMFGWDKKRMHDEADRYKAERIKKQFNKKGR